MKYESTIAGLTLVASALLAGPAASNDRGDDESPVGRSGFYIGASGVYASDIFESEVEDVVEDAFGVPVSVDVEESQGINARIGYRFAGGFFATEVQYEWVDDFDIGLSAVGVPVGSARLGGHIVTLNAKLIAPIWRIQPYLMAGAGGALYDFEDNTPLNVLGGSGTKTGFAGRAGGGIDFHLLKHLVLNAEAAVV